MRCCNKWTICRVMSHPPEQVMPLNKSGVNLINIESWALFIEIALSTCTQCLLCAMAPRGAHHTFCRSNDIMMAIVMCLCLIQGRPAAQAKREGERSLPSYPFLQIVPLDWFYLLPITLVSLSPKCGIFLVITYYSGSVTHNGPIWLDNLSPKTNNYYSLEST